MIALKRLSILAVPALLLFAAYLGMYRIETLPEPWKQILPYLPFTAIGVGMFLSLHFHRGRVFFVLLMLGIFSWCCGAYLRDGLSGFRERMIFQASPCCCP